MMVDHRVFRSMAYSDPLLSRAQVLIMENRMLQQERRQMRAERERAREMLQMNLNL